MAATYFSPGVYIEEVPSGPQPIAGASTNVMAIVGTTERGPVLDPKRVTGWADFVTQFGSVVGDSHTAAAVYGFFENRGPAAYIVRCDPSLSAEWTVSDVGGAAVFTVRAASPGSWANALDVSVAPDTSGGSGSAYVSAVTAIPGGVAPDFTVPVAATTGLNIGDTVVLISPTGSEEGTVTDVQPNLVLVNSAANLIALEPTTITTRTDGAATTLHLTQASGIKTGDVIQAILPDRSRESALVSGVAASGTGLNITLAGGFGADIDGAEAATRTAFFKGVINSPEVNQPLNGIVWSEELPPTRFELSNGQHIATASSGIRGVWNGVTQRFDFPTQPPTGDVTVEARLVAHLYQESIGLSSPSADDLAESFGFIPPGAAILLDGPGGQSTITRNAGDPPTFASVGVDPAANDFTSATFVLPVDSSSPVVVKCARVVNPGEYLDFGAGPVEIDTVENPGGNIYIITFVTVEPVAASAGADTTFPVQTIVNTRFVPLRFSVTVLEGGVAVESYAGMALDPNHDAYYFKDGIINDQSGLIAVGERTAVTAISAATMPAVAALSSNGANVAASSADMKDGFTTLEAEFEPSMVICPDALALGDDLLTSDVYGSMINHCEQFRRYAIIDAPDIGDDQDLADWRLTNVASTYAGTFAPHVNIINLVPGATQRVVKVPPSGFMAGVFARTDTERGVWKAPGNERVNGIVGLAEDYTQRRQDLLNPSGVNLIRAFPGRGRRLWGARNSTDDVTWRYINVRRLFNFMEVSIERSTQWVVFEPNIQSTWLRVRVSVENFLDGIWRAGGLAGASPEQAYRVRVGLGETMSETDIDLGLIIIEVAVAPAKPAEFVVFRFSHKRLSE